MRRLLNIPWWGLRLGCQLLCLAAFLYLFRLTEYDPATNRGGGPLVNLFFRLDPLVAASALVAARRWIALLWPAVVVLVATALLGRFFCGWLCPLGTLLDGFHRLLPARLTRVVARVPPGVWRLLRGGKYALLALVLASALLGMPLVGFVDPFALLMRGLTLGVDPATGTATISLFDWLYLHAPPWITAVSEPLLAFLKAHLLPFNPARPLLAGLALGMLLLIFALETLQRRFWCRNFCPLGVMLILGSAMALVRRLPGKVCRTCGQCASICRMGAFDEAGHFSAGACNLCMDCIDACPRDVAHLAARPLRTPAPLDVSRRTLLMGCAAGVALPLLNRALRPLHQESISCLIRPPGALQEADFLDQCVRCGECLKVCPTHALQPALLQANFEGMFSPHLAPRLGYCEYNCNLCGQACPSGAIAPLALEAKKEVVIGKARFDPTRCLPYAKNEPCIVCEEHCPLPQKAIRIKEVEVVSDSGERTVLQRPYLDRARCIGCGICENKCPLEGPAGVRVEAHGPRQVRRRHGLGHGRHAPPDADGQDHIPLSG